MRDREPCETVCLRPEPNDINDIEMILLDPEPPLADYREAMALANREAGQCLGENLLLSWYDRDRDFASPQHTDECHLASATPGYEDYGIHHGAQLRVDIHGGRFVFFYLPLDDS